MWRPLAFRLSRNYRKSILEKNLVAPISSTQCHAIEKALTVLFTVRTEEDEVERGKKSMLADDVGHKKVIHGFLPVGCSRIREKDMIREKEKKKEAGGGLGVWPRELPFPTPILPGLHFAGELPKKKSAVRDDSSSY